ncbi:MAG: ferredoxin [Methanoculleus sp.]|jgi:ferredoxin|nr:ferredoxin [Methanomicrobiales archaeon]NQS74718.1 ferredoxin [Methanoculleus sp.]
MVKVTIDRLECISCEACWTACPEVFEQNPEDEFSEITEQYRTNDNPAEGEVPEDLADCVWEAADSCPVAIIFVED